MQGLGVVSIKNKIEVYLSAAHVCFKGRIEHPDELDLYLQKNLWLMIIGQNLKITAIVIANNLQEVDHIAPVTSKILAHHNNSLGRRKW